MENFDTQLATVRDRVSELSNGVAATELQSQSQESHFEQTTSQGWTLRATFRFAADDLRKALVRIGAVRDEPTELRFSNGLLLVRKLSNVISCSDGSRLVQKWPDEIACQAAIRLTDGVSEAVGVSVSGDELAQLEDVQGELHVQLHGSGYDREVVLCGTRADSTALQVLIRCDPLSEDEVNSLPSGKVLPGSLLREALRVIQPFARTREAGNWQRDWRSGLVKMTKYGLGCNSPRHDTVYFETANLLETHWSVPVEILPRVRKCVQQFESFSVGVDSERTYISDGRGSFISWDTPADNDIKFAYYKLRADQFVASLSAKDIERAVKYIKSQVTDPDALVVLRASQDNGCVWFEAKVDGTTLKSPSVCIQIERNLLDVDVAPRFPLASLQKVFVGAKGPSLELRLCRGPNNEHRRYLWLIRSIDSYALGGISKTSGTKGNAQTTLCKVTRFAASVLEHLDADRPTVI